MSDLPDGISTHANSRVSALILSSQKVGDFFDRPLASAHPPFERYAHCSEAEKAGLGQAVIDALLAETEPPGLGEDETAVWRYSFELNRDRSVSDPTYAVALARLGERGVVELTALIGYYTMVAMTLNCHEIPLSEGVAPAFPLPQQARLS